MIAAVVLTYAPSDGMLEECVDALIAHGGLDLLVVVDNGTSAARRLAGRSCEVVTTGSNLGYSGGMNVGLRLALERGADAVAVLNDDVVVAAGWLPPLRHALDTDDRLGAAQPILLFGTGSVEGDGVAIINSAGVEIGPDGAGRDIGHGMPDGPEFASDRTIEAFTGGAVLIRSELLRQVGLFDERYFLYYEDVDLALRGAERGWQYRCVAGSRVWHRGSATVLTVGTLAARLRERNRLWLLLRHRPFRDIARGFWLAVRRVRHRPRAAHARGLMGGLAGAPRCVWRRAMARRLQTA